ncbi:uncharacterized protein LOC111628085 [Centruroides sculpturatus]|uniref:uncharacterized protein LOC111628085 n=1 Tax=Centruroides sculpturatus TaxID=218467 RepID=UPI000C6CEED0|nr:uncharacterized protein LOC111628085 [Centruroides sculpturatus]
MKTSMDMTPLLMLFIFAIVLSPTNSIGILDVIPVDPNVIPIDPNVIPIDPNVIPLDPLKDLSKTMDMYCGLSCTEKRDFRFCLIENGLQTVLDFAKNCAQGLQFFSTTDELTEFVCKLTEASPEVFGEFLKCHSSAQKTFSITNPKVYLIIAKCLETSKTC